HRVLADASGPAPVFVLVHFRTLRPGKREPRWTNRHVHFSLILHHRWNVGRILRQHARADRSLPIPDTSATVFEISFDYKIRGHVCPVNHALPNTPLDMDPDNHGLPRLRRLTLEGNKPLHPPELYYPNHQQRDLL